MSKSKKPFLKSDSKISDNLQNSIDFCKESNLKKFKLIKVDKPGYVYKRSYDTRLKISQALTGSNHYLMVKRSTRSTSPFLQTWARKISSL